MQTIRPAAPLQHASGKFIDNDDLTILHDIVGIALEHHIGPQRLVQMVHDLCVFKIIEIGALQKPCGFKQPFRLFRAVFGQHDGALFFVLFIIAIVQLLHDRIDAQIKV